LRKIATVVAALMLPVQAHALGVGEIEWNSALNQPLDAEIGLFSLGSVHENDIRVRLAPYDAYEQADIEYPSILRNLKFSVERRSSGGFYIKIHSSDAVKEPFLDILVEIDWPSGHLMREFTVLLDLPVMTDEEAGPVAAPETSTSAMTAEAATAGENEQPSPQGQVFGETASQQVSNDLRVGMVKRGDTLWGIAESMRSDKSVSVQQVMIALLKSNPNAFYNNNINNLKAGYVLRLDNPNLISEVSKVDAAREAQRQYQDWLAAKGRNTASARTGKSQDTAIGSGGTQNAGGPSLRLVAPDEADVGMSRSAGGTGQNRNVASMDLAALRQELDSALQVSDADKQENEQLRARIAELEEQIGKMQRLLSLRDDALSVLQANPQEQAQQTDQTAEGMTTPAPTAAATTPAGTAEETVAANTNTQQPEGAVGAADKTAALVAATQKAAPKAANTQKSAPNKTQAVGKDEGFVGTAMGYIKRTMSAAGSFLNPMALGGIVSGVLLLVGGAWFLRKRKISAEDLEQSMMVEVADKQLSEDLANGTVSDLEQKEETRAVELLDSTDGDSFEADIDEIDVLAEADVYLAYQRFDRAEELMREAINNEPQRLDLHFKLLEVFAASGNRDGFIEMARAIKAKGGQEDVALWDKVESMGAKIAAGDPLFSGALDSVESEAPAMHSVDNEFEAGLPGGELEADFAGLDDDLMLDLDAHIAADTQAADNVAQSADGDTIAGIGDELDLSADEETAEFSAALEDVTADAVESPVDESLGDSEKPLEFNLDELSALDTGDDAEGNSAQKKAEAYVPDNALEFEPVAVAKAGVADRDAETDAVSVSDDNVLGFDAGDGDDNAQEFSFDSVESVADAGVAEVDSDLTVAASSDALTIEDSDGEEVTFDFDSLESDSDAVAAIDDDLNDDIDWLTGVADDAVDEDSDTFFSSEDEVATKLDLIRAYIDMGDKESARNILTEVVEEGNDNQKQEAEELLRQIG